MNISKIYAAIVRLLNNLTLSSGMLNWIFSVFRDEKSLYSFVDEGGFEILFSYE